MERFTTALKANTITIRASTDRVVAVVEIVSPGNKSSQVAHSNFVRHAVALLTANIHMLLVDLFPGGKDTGLGLHQAIWSAVSGKESMELPEDKPLAVVADEAAGEIAAYLDPFAVGDPLPEMALFLTPGHYILCPMEESSQTEWQQFPPQLRLGPLESSS